MKLVNQACRISIGIFFIFSGLVKLNDPYGTAYKLEEYFEVFAADGVTFFLNFAPHSLFFSIFLSATEVILGGAILLYYRMKITMWISLLLISFFTFLKFYSFYFDKVKECGCFGTVIKLNPKESFYIDLILLAVILVLFVNRNRLDAGYNQLKGHSIMVLLAIASFGIGYYSKIHLPFVDNSQYSINTDLDKLTKPRETAKYRWIVEKNGKEYTFDEHYPSDTTYKYKSKILLTDSTKIVPEITNFIIYNDEGDFTQEALKDNKFLIIIANPAEAIESCDGACIEKIKNLNKELEKTGVKIMILTVPDSSFETYRHEVQLSGDFYYADDTTLKTMIRSNPGLMFLQNGIIKGKWHFNDTPDIETIKILIEKK